ncbi:hypothetical protein CDO73_05520 [Saccharibacillus sp. O23]|uniref:hypothetical protein n=1 Tax=Saccharibacillus sp. O23 TaxID=2009338 RepID=UPI000B4E2B69|nr:hypothetical protein [Saccharibacillus sp. O23]OWR31933.1 hypothetical protein CDO73_05520 [Saccharibacillus sp. O23]
MKKEPVLSEIVIELSYFLYLLRRTRVDYNEIGSRLRTVVSAEVADFIRSSVNLLRQGGKFADYRVLFESKLLEYARNPDIRVDELKALHSSIAILEKCIRRDWDEFIEFTLLLLKNETWAIDRSGAGGSEIPLRVMRVQRFLKEKDEQNVTVERDEFERYKNEEWNRNPFMTDEEIQQVLSEGAKGRAATHEEMMLMSETLIAERAKNPSITLKQVMKQLGLEDIGTHIDFDFDEPTS